MSAFQGWAPDLTKFLQKVRLVSSFHCRPAGGLRFNCCPSLWQQWTGESYSIRFFEGSVSFLKVDIGPQWNALVPGVCNISNSGNPVSSSKRQCAMWSKLDQIWATKSLNLMLMVMRQLLNGFENFFVCAKMWKGENWSGLSTWKEIGLSTCERWQMGL